MHYHPRCRSIPLFTEATFEKAAFFTSQVFLLRRQIKKASAAFQPLIFIVHLSGYIATTTSNNYSHWYNFMPSFFTGLDIVLCSLLALFSPSRWIIHILYQFRYIAVCIFVFLFIFACCIAKDWQANTLYVRLGQIFWIQHHNKAGKLTCALLNIFLGFKEHHICKKRIRKCPNVETIFS